VSPTVSGCLLEGHNDDGIALHGAYSLVVDASAAAAPAETGAPEGGGTFQIWVTSRDYSAGDRVRLYSPVFSLAATVTVLAVAAPQPPGTYAPPRNSSRTMPSTKLQPEPHAWYQLLTVQGARPAGLAFDWVAFNADKACRGFALLRSTIRNHRARGMLIKASDGAVLGNHIENSTLGGIVITPELHWGEGDFSSNLTVAGNTVRSVRIGKQCFGGLALGAIGPNGRFASGPPFGFSDIRIRNNTFDDVSETSLWVSSAARVEVSGNRFLRPYAYAPVATCCPPYPIPKNVISWVTEASGVTFSGNCVQSPGQPGVTVFNATGSVTGSHFEAFAPCPI
jgi:hypothetical protein